MKIVDQITSKLENDVSFRVIIKIVLILLAIFLIQKTSGIWLGLWSKIWTIIKPFVYGFIIAYILRLPISWGEEHKISKKIMIPILYVVIFAFLYFITASVLPLLLERANDFINSIITGVSWLYNAISKFAENGAPTWIEDIVTKSIEALSDLKNMIPGVSSTLPNVLTNVISGLTTFIFSIIISIYVCFGWEKIKFNIYKIIRNKSRLAAETLNAVNKEVSDYIGSVFILMIIKLVEYSLVYLLIGNEDWLILGIITSISILIPYLGPTVANSIGILTSLTLPTANWVSLIIILLVLSNIDGAVIDPMVHAHNTNVTPLWAIFSIFVGNAFLGVPGIIIAIPVFLSIRVIIKMYSGLDILGKLSNNEDQPS